MEKQLRVVKADGTTEAYLHTKVIGAINNALSAAGRPDMAMAEDLAEVVTFYLYKKMGERKVDSSEIFAIVKAVLSATGFEAAAAALAEHARGRRLRRTRTEVLAVDVQDLADLEELYGAGHSPARVPWDKARIVHDLTTKSGISPHTARAVASMVEERILNMGMTMLPLSLIKQIVLGETATVLRAQRALHTA